MNAHKVIESLIALQVSHKLDSEIMGIIIDKINESVKFEFDFGEFPTFSDDDMFNVTCKLKLPFPLCYFEIPKLGAVLAREIESDNLILVNVFISNKFYGYIPTPPELMLAIDKDIGKIVSLSKSEPLLKAWSQAGEAPDGKEDMYLISTLISLAIRGISVLNCSNVICVDNEPSPALNKKRAKAKKIPLFSFKTLHIDTERARSVSSKSCCSDRVGPRLHLRRGHIRRLDENRTTWVNSCMVGDAKSGAVKKDYHVTR